MSTESQLRASIAITPPTEASRKIRKMVVWGEIADCLNRARKAVTKRNLDAIHTWLNRAALSFLELKDGQEIDVLQATLSGLSSPALARELERRARAIEEKMG